MNDWHMGEQSSHIQSCVRKVLSELSDGACFRLRDEGLEVKVVPKDGIGVWAYFPMNRRRLIAREFNSKAETRVLLMLRAPNCQKESAEALEGLLRHHLGHALLHLRDPKARNGCLAAEKEWDSETAAAEHRINNPTAPDPPDRPLEH